MYGVPSLQESSRDLLRLVEAVTERLYVGFSFICHSSVYLQANRVKGQVPDTLPTDKLLLVDYTWSLDKALVYCTIK